MSPVEDVNTAANEDDNQLPLAVWLGSAELAFGYPPEVVKAALSGFTKIEFSKSEVQKAVDKYVDAPAERE